LDTWLFKICERTDKQTETQFTIHRPGTKYKVITEFEIAVHKTQAVCIYAVDWCKTRQRDVRQESSRTRDDPFYVNAVENSVPDQESNVDEYSTPIQYEDVNQLGSNIGVYHKLNPVTIGVPHVYSELNEHPKNNV